MWIMFGVLNIFESWVWEKLPDIKKDIVHKGFKIKTQNSSTVKIENSSTVDVQKYEVTS